MMGDQVTLNVGGQTFDTSLMTMTKDPNSLLAKLALHDFADGRRSAFIDQDGTNFRYILNYLRDGECVLPTDEQQQQELQKEAEFFQVEGLIDLLSDTNLPAAKGPANLSDLHHNKQEAALIDKLRQEAGPLVIEQFERAVIEAAYNVTRVDPAYVASGERMMLKAGFNITWNLSDTQPRYLRISQMALPGIILHMPQDGYAGWKPAQHFYQRYKDVIEYDLGRLGYHVSTTPHSRVFQDAIVLSSNVLEDCMAAVHIYSSNGPAIRVLQASNIYL